MHKQSEISPVRLWSIFTIALLLAISTASCGGDSGQDNKEKIKLAPLAEMPTEVQSAPVSVQQAYQFAVANPDVVSEMPCYCGCGSMGHTSNYSCYVAGEDADGSPIYDGHALGCSICVDITQDTMRLLDQDKSVPEIRAYIDKTYSQYGPSNMP